jgi:hypothetical protein
METRYESVITKQILLGDRYEYLEAEARGHRRDRHRLLFRRPRAPGIRLQEPGVPVAYHFTVGGAVDDPRLTTLPPYGAHLQGQERGMDLP